MRRELLPPVSQVAQQAGTRRAHLWSRPKAGDQPGAERERRCVHGDRPAGTSHRYDHAGCCTAKAVRSASSDREHRVGRLEALTRYDLRYEPDAGGEVQREAEAVDGHQDGDRADRVGAQQEQSRERALAGRGHHVGAHHDLLARPAVCECAADELSRHLRDRLRCDDQPDKLRRPGQVEHTERHGERSHGAAEDGDEPCTEQPCEVRIAKLVAAQAKGGGGQGKESVAWVSMTLPVEIEALVDVLATQRNVVAVALGGSRATGSADAASDWDLAVYYRGEIGTAALACYGDVHPPGSWGRIM